LIDFHIHALPGFDDGADTAAVSLAMLGALARQGIARAVLTPHFYPNETVRAFLARREEAARGLGAAWSALSEGDRPNVRLCMGAEVYLSRETAEDPELASLCCEGSRQILIELPFEPYAAWMGEALWNIQRARGLSVTLAHLERYLHWYAPEDFDALLEAAPGACAQFNTATFGDKRRLRFLESLFRAGVPIVLGSDAHNMTTRPPDFSAAFRYFSRRGGSELEKHIKLSEYM
jgi:protein-tyrosine phosphatase